MYEPFYEFILEPLPEFELDRERLNALLDCIEVNKKYHLLNQGEICQFVGFVLHGCVRVYKIDENGKDSTMSFHTQYQSFGDYDSFINQTHAQYSVQAIKRSKILKLTRQAMLFIKALPGGSEFLRLHTQAYATLMRRRTEALLGTPDERLRSLLKEEPYLLKQVPNYLLASYLGMQPETLSRKKRDILKNL